MSKQIHHERIDDLDWDKFPWLATIEEERLPLSGYKLTDDYNL